MSTTRPVDRRSFLRLGTAGVAGAILLPGCARGVSSSGQDFDQPKSKVPGKYKDRAHKLVVWSSFGGVNGQTLDRLAAKFNESQDDIYADFQYQGDYDQTAVKLAAALQSGTAPDLIILNQVYTGKYLLRGLLEPLDEYFEDDFKKQFFPQLVNEWVVDGKMYKVPFARSTPLLYYNKDVFESAGLPMRGPKTWSELRSWSGEIGKQKGPDNKPVRSHIVKPIDWFFQAEVWEFGGVLSKDLKVTMDHEEAVTCATWFQDAIVKQKTAIPGEDSNDFTNGFAATVLGSTAELRGIEEAAKFNVGAAFLPKQEEVGVPTGGSGWAVFKGVPKDRKDAGAEIIKFFSRPEISAEWSLGTGYVPIVKGAGKQATYRTEVKKDPNFDVARKQLPRAKPTDPIRSFIGSSAVIINKALENIYQAKHDVKRELSAASEKLSRDAEKVQKDYDKYFK